MKTGEIISRLEEIYPLSAALEGDNPGLLVGRQDREVSGILVALDATESVIEQAIEEGADLILTHHPMIYSPVRQVNDGHFTGDRILTLAENRISCYAMHTNFDTRSMAALNADQLGLKNTSPLRETEVLDGHAVGLGCIGDLTEPVSLSDFAALVRRQMETSVRCYADREDRMVSRAAVCGGSGRSVIGEAIRKGADVIVTGDIDYHTGIDCMAQGISVLDAGHYGTEHCFIPYMTDLCRRLFPDCRILSAPIAEPFSVLL